MPLFGKSGPHFDGVLEAFVTVLNRSTDRVAQWKVERQQMDGKKPGAVR